MREHSAGAKANVQWLESELDLLDRVAADGGSRDRTALALRLAAWMTFAEPIVLADGTRYTDAGFRLADQAGARVYLAPGGDVVWIPQEPARAVRREPLVDADIDWGDLVGRLRLEAVRHFLGGVMPADWTGPLVPRALAEILMAAGRVGASGRATILELLADAMRPAPGWDEAAARLKAGFEHALGDPSPVVRAVGARGLVRLAAGLGPAPPGNPERIPGVLFTVPRPDVHAATLAAVLDLPRAAFARLREAVAPHVPALLTASDPDLRRLAADVQAQLGAEDVPTDVVDDLDAGGRRRVDALRRLASEPPRPLGILLPRVLDASADPDAETRAAALAALEARIGLETQAARERMLAALLRSDDPRLVAAAVAMLEASLPGEAHRAGADDRPDTAFDAARTAPAIDDLLRAALDGPEDSRAAVARLWIARHADAAAPAAAGAFAELLRHRDPVVRQVAMRALAHQAPSEIRAQVRDELHRHLVERLRDPVPALRVEAARALLGQRSPGAPLIVEHLALDPDPGVRLGVRQALRAAGEDGAAARAAETAGVVAELFDGLTDPARDTPAWDRALAYACGLSSPWVVDLLIGLLRELPAAARGPFESHAVGAVDEALLARSDDPADILAVCRRLLEPPLPCPEHAARLAGRVAALDPAAFVFVWLLHTGTHGRAAADAAGAALGDLVAVPKAPAVEVELAERYATATDPAARALLARLLGRPG